MQKYKTNNKKQKAKYTTEYKKYTNKTCKKNRTICRRIQKTNTDKYRRT